MESMSAIALISTVEHPHCTLSVEGEHNLRRPKIAIPQEAVRSVSFFRKNRVA
jgi:hypothetical protein